MGKKLSKFATKIMRDEAATQGKICGRHDGSYGRSIVKVIVRDGREFQLHATKGWRSRRA